MTLTARPRFLIRFAVLAALALCGVVLALSSTGTSPVGAQDGSVPAKPTGVVATATHDSVALAWDDPSDASITHYQIFRRDRDVHDAGEFVTIEDDTGSAAASYTDDTVEPEKRYVYRVKAVNQHGASTWSNFVRADTPAAPDPADLAPSGLEVSLVENRVTLTWDAPASDAASVTGYEILRRRPNDGEAALTTLVADTGNAETGYTDDSANEPGVRYTYRVKALRDGEQSRVSNHARIDLPEDYAQDTPEPEEEPSPEALAPSGLTAEAAEDSGVALSWTAPAEDAGSVTGYEVLRGQGSAALATLVADTGSIDTTYTDSGVTGDLDGYRYQVKARRGGDASQGSNVAGVLQSAHAGAIVPLADVTLISNVGQTAATGAAQVSTTQSQAQGFTTGSDSGGYTLGSVELAVSSFSGTASDITVSIYSESSGNPGTVVHTLTTPASISAAVTTFTAPSGATLAASTTYYVVISTTGSGISVSRTNATAEDTGGVSGWSIADFRRFFGSSGWNITTDPIRMRVNGDAATSTNSPATGAPTITGTPAVGELLTADISNIGDSDGIADADFEYQWIAFDGSTDSDIDGATGETYRPLLAHVDQTIKVRVSFDDDNDNAESLTSTTTTAVTASTYGQVIWAATLTVEEETVAAGTFFGYSIAGRGSLEPNSFTHDRNARGSSTVTGLQYLEGGSLRLDLNGNLGSEDFNLYLDGAPFLIESPGMVITLEFSDHGLTWTDGQEVEVRLTVNRPVTGAPVVTGTPEVGETLTADISAIMDEDGVPVADQWISNDGTGDSDISGATDPTFTPGGSDEGKSLRVRVSFTDNANFREVLTSDPVDPVGQDDWLWAATMTVGTGILSLGYQSDPEAGALTSSPTFTHNSTSYDVEFILLNSNGQLRLGMDQDLPPDFHLHVGTDQFDKSDAIHTAGTGIYQWNSTGLSWSVGDTIPVWLAPVPSGPGVASVTVDQASITQTLADVTVTMANPQNEVQVVFLRYRVAGDAWPSLANLILSDSGTAITFTLTGLTGNTDYDVAASLDSTFASGVKTASFTTSPTKPGQARGVTIGILNGQFLITWSAPANDGGSAITGYTVQWKSGSQSFGDPSREHTTGASSTSYLIAGLTNGTEYTVRVIAVNAVGDGPPSNERKSTPVGPPDAPPNVQAGSGHQQLTVSWGAPNDRGSAITEYTLQWKSGGQNFTSSRQRTIAGTSRTDTIPSLDNGTEYTVRVRATTALGDSDWSAEAKGTPREGPHVSLVKVKEPVSCTVTFVALEFVNLEAATEYQAHLRFRAQGSSSWTVLSPRGFWSSGIPSGAARGELSGPSPAFTLTDLAYETIYEVQAALDSGFVDGLAATTFSTPNLSEAGLMPLSPGDGTLVLRMTRPTSEGRVDGYLLQWKSGDEEYDDTDTSERQADVPGSGDREYTITGLDNGVEYTVRAMAYNDNGVGVPSSEVRGTPEAPPNSPARGAPTISGTAQVGETLTADTDGIEDDDGLADAVYSYQWLADGADISGATGETYTPAYDDERKVISVKVSFADDRDFEETLTSEPTAAVEPRPNSPATGAPTISGTAQVGETLTVDTSGIDDGDGMSGAVFSYQWLANGADVAGATSDTYTPVADDVGKAIKVRVTFRDDRNHQESLTSAATAAVEAAADESAVWSATLTVGSIADFRGFWKGVGMGELTSEVFTLDGVDYTVKVLADSNGLLFELTLDKALPVGFTLQVGATTLSSQDASIREFSSGATQYGWANQGVMLADVDTVEVSLTLAE